MTDLTKIRAALDDMDKGTPGEWQHRKPPVGRDSYDSGFVEAPGKHPQGYGLQILGDDEEGYPTKLADIKAIVSALNNRAEFRRMVDRVEELETALEGILWALRNSKDDEQALMRISATTREAFRDTRETEKENSDGN